MNKTELIDKLLHLGNTTEMCCSTDQHNAKELAHTLIDEYLEAINYTHSSTQLKDKEVPTFMFWMDCNSIRMVEHNRFIKENNIMSFQEVSQKYINEMINL